MKRIKQRTKRHVAFLLALLLCGQLLAGQALAFSDVGPGMEPAFQEAIAAMADRGYLCGVGGDRFAPDDTVTRAMVAAVLYRMAEEPGAYSGSFADVGARDWFREAVNWASARGIMVGVAKDRFAPNDPVTREQLMAALYRFAIYRNAAQETGMDHISSCADFTRISGYAVPAMEWAVQEGLLLLALPESRLYPQALQDRKWLALCLYRFDETVLHQPAADDPLENNCTLLYLSGNSTATLSNTDGQFLTYTRGEYAGTMPVVQESWIVNYDPQVCLTVPNTEVLSIRHQSGPCDWSFLREGAIAAVRGNGIDRVDFYEDNRVLLQGEQMTWTVTGPVTAEGKVLAQITGTANGSVVIAFSGETPAVMADDGTWIVTYLDDVG